MDHYRAKLRADGGILLGDRVSCDGFAYGRDIRVQTHVHTDHMVAFDTSKANQEILMSPETKRLLCAIYNADIPYRKNICTIGPEEHFQLGAESIELVPSNHMLGSVQVRVTCADGYRVGYSSDFFWPMDEVIMVDELVVDSTYGDPTRARLYDQQTVEEKLISLVVNNISAGRSTAVIGYNGRLQHALHICGGIVDVPVICSPKVHPVVDVYRQHGYAMPPVLKSDSTEAIDILKRRDIVVALATFTERRHLPWVDRFRKISLSAYMTNRKDPVMLYDNGDSCIALTDHADFHGTLEYVRSTGARMVWTDPRSGNAAALAEAISGQLGVESSVMPAIHSLEWG